MNRIPHRRPSRDIALEDEDPKAIPSALDVFHRIAAELEDLEPGEAARIAQTLVTWFGGDAGFEDEEH